MSIDTLDPAIAAAVWISIKASVLLGATAVVQALIYRRTSAATRHLVWMLAVGGLLLLPILSVSLPQWTVVRITPSSAPYPTQAVNGIAESAAMAAPSTSLPESAGSMSMSPSMPLALAVVAIYGAGVFIALFYWMVQWWSVRRLEREATDVTDSQWMALFNECAERIGAHRQVRLRRSRQHSMPMVVGVHRPTILVPAIADTWPDDQRRAVMLHELAHVVRHDCLTQSLSFAACIMYWFHPVAWWVARRVRIERELACDDRVIAAGTRPREYAGHLLEIAYSLGGLRLPALAVTMARPRQLESRMLAAIDAARNRRVPAFRVGMAGAALTVAFLLPLASATSTVRADDAPKVDLDGPLATRLFAQQQTAPPDTAQPGTWEIRPTDTSGTVHLRLAELRSSSGTVVPLQQLEGLTAAQLTGAGGPVQFRMRRDAGTFLFEGVMRNRIGAGTFSFTPDAGFAAELAKRGFARPTALEQYQLARHDVGYAFLDELNKQGYTRPQTSELVRAGQHGIDTAFMRDMGALGYRLGTLQPLITLRDHGVTPSYVRELADLGYKGLPADELRRARDHGIVPEYVREMREAGYGSLPMEQLIRVRDHGVVPEYVRAMRQFGYNVPIDDLVRARDHGIDVEYVKGMASLGYADQPLETLVRLRDHGITADYVQELKALGYDRLPAEDLVTLRDRGLTPDRIRAMNTRARSRLPVNQLRSLAERGMW